MKIKIDENIPIELVVELRQLGHDADSVIEESLSGAADSLVLRAAKAESRVLFTLDRGIGDVRKYPPGEYSGIVVFVLKRPTLRKTLQFIRRHLPQVLQQSPEGKLLIVSDNSIRIRQ